MLLGSVNFTVYRQDTFAFAFIFKDTQGDPLRIKLSNGTTKQIVS
jgi:hypothetical protein